jgi:primosomal replication protein N
MNRLVLSACVVERGALRYTPAGLPALDLSLRHESQVTQDGLPRQVSMEIKARAVGDITGALSLIELGSTHGFAGFLGSQRNGRGIVFHVTELD